jgi:hypothetical protein
MNKLDISKLSDAERKSYSEGMAIVNRKLASARLEKKLPAITQNAVAAVMKRFEANPAAFLPKPATAPPRASKRQAKTSTAKSFSKSPMTIHRFSAGPLFA